MQQLSVTLTESQEAVINAAIEGTGDTIQKWIDTRLESVLKQQESANLAKAIRKNAKNAATLVRYGNMSLEKAIMQIGFTDQVTEFGGIGKLYKLILTLGNDYFVPSDKIKEPVKAVNPDGKEVPVTSNAGDSENKSEGESE